MYAVTCVENRKLRNFTVFLFFTVYFIFWHCVSKKLHCFSQSELRNFFMKIIRQYYTSNSNCPIRKLSLCHVSMKLIAISRLTSSISEPAFLLTMFHPMFPGNMGWNIIRVDHAGQHA